MKRLLTAWQFYLRVLARMTVQGGTGLSRAQAIDLILVAEMAARRPALQPKLHGPHDGETGLRLLAEATSDVDWVLSRKAVRLMERSTIALAGTCAPCSGAMTP
ncbi:hypothetical protein [Actinocorallia longicatena]|uniref:Uncharacterized protein n=1 Tax=Actinocorallia longicatena TaxID=111803 RepID=A0ABP6PVL2_9ACTN